LEASSSLEDIKQLFAETDRRFRETDRRLNELGKQIGGLGNRLGEFVEGVVRPGLVRLFRERGLQVHETHRDLEARRGELAGQVDLVVINERDVVAVEVKSKLMHEDVDEHTARLDKFKLLFPHYREARVVGAVAAMVIPADVARHAEKMGLFVVGQRGDDAVLLNSDGFEPRTW
jgi:hypothetical protein